MIATTHGREMNSRQPSRRSPTTEFATARTVGASRIDAISSAETKNVTESIAMAIAGLPRATMIAPSAGETIDSVLRDSWDKRVRLLQAAVAHGLLDQPDRYGARECVGDAEHALDQRHVPDVGLTREEEDGRHDLRRCP